MEFTEEAKKRIELAKTVMGCVQSAVGKELEDWHVFTYRHDKKNDNPNCFKIHRTKTKAFLFGPTDTIPKEEIFNIEIYEAKKQILVTMVSAFNKDILEKEIAALDEFADWKVEVK